MPKSKVISPLIVGVMVTVIFFHSLKEIAGGIYDCYGPLKEFRVVIVSRHLTGPVKEILFPVGNLETNPRKPQGSDPHLRLLL
jgi:hypothetical protein